jgi:hypothetical protein
MAAQYDIPRDPGPFIFFPGLVISFSSFAKVSISDTLEHLDLIYCRCCLISLLLLLL